MEKVKKRTSWGKKNYGDNQGGRKRNGARKFRT